MPKTNNGCGKATSDNLHTIKPKTNNQQKAFDAWNKKHNIMLNGSAGSGKTFMGMYLGLKEVLNPDAYQRKLIICRSTVATRDMGFLPGTQKEKEDAFTMPYKSLVEDLFGDKSFWGILQTNKQLEFISTSYIRGVTLDNCVILVDEMQNMNFHELCSVATRVGKDSRIIFAGDFAQSDFTNKYEQQGLGKFTRIVEAMTKFSIVTFTPADILRSGWVRDFLITKELLEKEGKI